MVQMYRWVLSWWLFCIIPWPDWEPTQIKRNDTKKWRNSISNWKTILPLSANLHQLLSPNWWCIKRSLCTMVSHMEYPSMGKPGSSQDLCNLIVTKYSHSIGYRGTTEGSSEHWKEHNFTINRPRPGFQTENYQLFKSQGPVVKSCRTTWNQQVQLFQRQQ